MGVEQRLTRPLRFTIRKGVTWSDGQPFSAQDVVFTFNLLKKYPALDLNCGLVRAEQRGAHVATDQVTFNFKAPAVSYFYYIADETPIVPAHIWSTIKNPTTFLDPDPIGTGPYVLSNCNTRRHALHQERPLLAAGAPADRDCQLPVLPFQHFGQPGPEERRRPVGLAVHPQHQQVLHFRQPEVLPLLVRARLQREHLAQPRLTRCFPTSLSARRSPTPSTVRWSARSASTAKSPGPTRQTSLRRRSRAGTTRAWRPSTAMRTPTTPPKAISVLEAAGYKKGSNGIFEKDGKPLSFTMINNAGFSDWVSAVNVIQSELKAVGIQVTPDNLSGSTYSTDVADGHFQLAYDWDSGGPTPYYELRAVLDSANTAAVGSPAASNYERYSSTGDRRPYKAVRGDNEHSRPAPGHRPARARDALAGAGDPRHRAGGLVPVRHPAHRGLGNPERPLRPAGPVPYAGLGRRPAAPVLQVGSSGQGLGRASHERPFCLRGPRIVHGHGDHDVRRTKGVSPNV